MASGGLLVTAPAEGTAEQARFVSRKDKALATIVLAIDPSLLYLIGAVYLLASLPESYNVLVTA